MGLTYIPSWALLCESEKHRYTMGLTYIPSWALLCESEKHRYTMGLNYLTFLVYIPMYTSHAFVSRCVWHNATQLGSFLTLVAWCHTTRRDTKIRFRVNRPLTRLARHSGRRNYLKDMRSGFESHLGKICLHFFTLMPIFRLIHLNRLDRGVV
jgi:hypothetical protein